VFGDWFACGHFDDDWALAQLDVVFRVAKKIDSDHRVAGRLAELAPAKPLEAVRALRNLVESDADGWNLFGWETETRSVLGAALASRAPAARQEAIDLVHRLGSRGFFGFRDLLAEPET
jgi:hypothetical protein